MHHFHGDNTMSGLHLKCAQQPLLQHPNTDADVFAHSNANQRFDGMRFCLKRMLYYLTHMDCLQMLPILGLHEIHQHVRIACCPKRKCQAKIKRTQVHHSETRVTTHCVIVQRCRGRLHYNLQILGNFAQGTLRLSIFHYDVCSFSKVRHFVSCSQNIRLRDHIGGVYESN